jgi:hypothetical protein
MAEAVAAAEHGGIRLVPRSHAQTEAFFTSLEMVEPGVVPVLAWRQTTGRRQIRTARTTTLASAANHNQQTPQTTTPCQSAGLRRPSPLGTGMAARRSSILARPCWTRQPAEIGAISRPL